MDLQTPSFDHPFEFAVVANVPYHPSPFDEAAFESLAVRLAGVLSPGGVLANHHVLNRLRLRRRRMCL